ncbi:MAG: type II toxin-antitoxin system prevent-host-death family antitoxin, partial [Mesorhizobium sp.]|nr:type II toxin-antitoxin system prevent-host-death family antitoxin [Mesorhizobium sp.]
MSAPVRTIAATEAKSRFSELIGDVERGAVIDVTRHGKVIARLGPPVADEDQRRARMQAAAEAIRELKRSGRKTGITIEDILSARDEG